jgi:hypothetical protein
VSKGYPLQIKAIDLIVEDLIYPILFFWTETVKVRVGR